jgi:hypothetical protein
MAASVFLRAPNLGNYITGVPMARWQKVQTILQKRHFNKTAGGAGC